MKTNRMDRRRLFLCNLHSRDFSFFLNCEENPHVSAKILAPVPTHVGMPALPTNKRQEIVWLLFSRFPQAKSFHPSLPAKSAPPLLPQSAPGHARRRAFAASGTRHSRLQKVIAGNPPSCHRSRQ